MVKTRFAPSPTGQLHLGNIRTALFNALYAKAQQGTFLLRIENTDLERSKDVYIDQLKQDLLWLGLNWQEGPDQEGEHGPYLQAQRFDIYQSDYQRLIDAGVAYPCYCSQAQLAMTRKVQQASGQPPRYPGTCRHLSEAERAQKEQQGIAPTLRFKLPADEYIEFDDLVKGKQRFASNDIGDFIIRRADGTAAFMFCNAIDDAMMGVTHVFRGDDHLTNTPRQLMILNALNLTPPQYGHLSTIVGDDGSPLSKRTGSLSVAELKDQGYLPLAVINYLARCGHYYDNKPYMDFAELAAHFNVSSLSRSPAKYDVNQLNHWQKEAVMRLDPQVFERWLVAHLQEMLPGQSFRSDFFNLMQENIQFVDEAKQWATIIYQDSMAYSSEQIEVFKNAGKSFFEAAKAAFAEHGVDFKAAAKQIGQQCDVKGKSLFLPLRVALTGQTHGPEMPRICDLMGADKISTRLEQVLSQL